MTKEEAQQLLGTTWLTAANDLINLVERHMLHSDLLEGDRDVIRTRMHYWWRVAQWQVAANIHEKRELFENPNQTAQVTLHDENIESARSESSGCAVENPS